MDKFVVSKAPKGIEGKTISLEFVGNLDTAIHKMKRNVFCELEDVQIVQLKCCLLFLCGMPFSKISEKLNVSKGTISKYLNDPTLEGLLSFEYQVLLQMNRVRLQPENKNSKIKRAVQVFIEQNGNYQKTSALTGFSDRTLSRYFQDPKLSEILENEALYAQFIEVKNTHISEIKSKAALENVKQQSIKALLLVLEPNGIVEKRYLSLATAMLVEQISDLEGLMSYTKMSKANIESYLLDTSRCTSFFPEIILESFRQKALEITTGNENQNLLEVYERNIINLYLSGRYSYEEISEILGIKNSKVIADIIKEKAKTLLSVEEYVELQKHKTEVTLLLQAPSGNKRLIKDGKTISIVKPEILYVEPYEYRVLVELTRFLNVYESICMSDPKEELHVMEANLLVYLPYFQNLLTEEAYAKVETILTIEKLLVGNELQKKYQYIISVIRVFFSKNFDLEVTAQTLEIPVEVLIRILQNEFVDMNYGVIIAEYVKQAIRNYQTQKTKEKSEKMYVYC